MAHVTKQRWLMLEPVADGIYRFLVWELMYFGPVKTILLLALIPLIDTQ
jgi:hypothetical protein